MLGRPGMNASASPPSTNSVGYGHAEPSRDLEQDRDRDEDR